MSNFCYVHYFPSRCLDCLVQVHLSTLMLVRVPNKLCTNQRNLLINFFSEKATSETNTTEQWDVIIDICDKAAANPKNSKECIRSIMKRMGHNDPHVAIQAITLLDSCIKNCGKLFHLEIASRDFENEFQRLMTKNSPPVAKKMRV